MAIRGIRGPVVFVSLLALGAWAGSALAQGTALPGVSVSVSIPGVTVPAVSATVPVVGISAATPSVTATVPVVNATVPAVTAPSVATTVPSVGVTVPSATVSTPVAQVTTPSVAAATPSAPAVTPSPVPAPKASAPVSAAKAATSAVKPVVSASKTATTATSPRTGSSSSTATRPSTTAARTRTARLRAAHLQTALLRAARARRIRLERAARERQRILRAQRAAQTPPPAQPTTPPVLDPTTLFFIDPAQPLVPYQTPEAIAASIDPVAAALLPISTAMAAAALPGVSARSSSTLHATAPPEPVLAPSGGFDGSSRFERFLQARSAPVQQIAPSDVNTPVISRAPVLTEATGGRVLEAVAGGGRGTGVNTPLGRIAIRHGDYVFGNTRYPVASVGGVLTTALIALAVLVGIAGLLAAGAAADRFLAASGRRGSERTREDLYAAAKRKNIPGRSRMSKAELRRALDDY